VRKVIDKDGIVGKTKEIKGGMREAVGKAVGDRKREVEGKIENVEGKAQGAVGALEDATKEKWAPRPAACPEGSEGGRRGAGVLWRA
jgi:uncharacterized protein YjbJ (UPF0337 family)